MDFAALPSVGAYVIGALFGAAPLALGIVVGIYLARRGGWLGPREALSPEQAQSLIRGLFQWTNTLVGDFDQCREQMESIRRNANSAENGQSSGMFVELMSQMIQANQQMQQRLSEAEEALAKQSQKIAVYVNEARTDVLTGLPNRREFDEQLVKSHAQWQRYGVGYTLLMLDVDRFKQFNDAHGHLAGDAALRSLAVTVGKTLRETDVLARIGGEEFAAILTVTSGEESHIAAERVRRAVEEATIPIEGKSLRITVSCGLAEPRPNEQIVDVVRRADLALYASKHAGRNCGHCHDGQRAIPVTTPQEDSAGGDLEVAELAGVCDALRDRFMTVTRA